MPFVLKNQVTSEIYACKMLNNYNILYYGIKSWQWKDEAEAGASLFLQEQAVDKSEDWVIIEVEDNRLKLFNVKLKNDPKRKLYLDDSGTVHTRF